VAHLGRGPPQRVSRSNRSPPAEVAKLLIVRVYPYSGRSSQPYRLTASWGGSIQAEELVPMDWGKPPVEAP
jgi:hypothetical protein